MNDSSDLPIDQVIEKFDTLVEEGKGNVYFAAFDEESFYCEVHCAQSVADDFSTLLKHLPHKIIVSAPPEPAR